MTMTNPTQLSQDERRQHPRIQPPGLLVVTRFGQMRRVTNAVVSNISEGGAALRTNESIDAGERLSFSVAPSQPPIHCEVLECIEMGDDDYLLRCRCILGGFEL